MKFLLLTIFLILLCCITPAVADSVVYNGITYTCTNACEITTGSGGTLIKDCCGGTVTTTVVYIGKE